MSAVSDTASSTGCSGVEDNAESVSGVTNGSGGGTALSMANEEEDEDSADRKEYMRFLQGLLFLGEGSGGAEGGDAEEEDEEEDEDFHPRANKRSRGADGTCGNRAAGFGLEL